MNTRSLGTLALATAALLTGCGHAGVVGLALGAGNNCALLADGTVRCNGLNDEGSVGDGTTAYRADPVPVVGLDDATQLTVGQGFACALRAGGEVVCWGADAMGQLGDGATANETRPHMTQVMTGATQISSNFDLAAAVGTDGRVYVWGGAPLASASSPAPMLLPGPMNVAEFGWLSSSGFCARSQDGTTYCSLDDSASAGPGHLVLFPMSGVQLATDLDNACVVMVDQTVRCIGYNDHGQLGDGMPDASFGTYHSIPATPVGLTGVVEVQMGDNFACARLADGTVQCWGANESQELGTGAGPDRATPAPVPGVTGAIGLAAGPFEACAIHANGGTTCWGLAQSGLFANGPSSPHDVGW